MLVEPGKAVNFATHVFTISNDDDYMISVPASAAVTETTLPERPDYSRANTFLIDARRRALNETLP